MEFQIVVMEVMKVILNVVLKVIFSIIIEIVDVKKINFNVKIIHVSIKLFNAMDYQIAKMDLMNIFVVL